MVRFFQHPDFQSKSRDKKSKGLRKEEKAGKLQSRNETKREHRQLDSPHKIAEAVRDQSLNKDSELKLTSLKSSGLRVKPHDNKTNLPQMKQEEKNDATSEFMERKTLVDENSNHIVVCASTGNQQSDFILFLARYPLIVLKCPRYLPKRQFVFRKVPFLGDKTHTT